MSFFNLEHFTLFLETHALLAYLVLFCGAYFETLIGPNFFIYGEFIFVPGAALAGLGFLNIWLVCLALCMWAASWATAVVIGWVLAMVTRCFVKRRAS